MKNFCFCKISALICFISLGITSAPLSQAAAISPTTDPADQTNSNPTPKPPEQSVVPAQPPSRQEESPRQDIVEIPPEVLQQLLQNPANLPFPTDVSYPAAPQHLSAVGRILLVLLAGIVLLLGIIFCRFLSMKNYFHHSRDPLFLIFGLFGSLAAILIAAAATASLHLHIAAVCCTIVSGFMICSLGLAQFSRAHKLIIVNTDQTAKISDRKQFEKQDQTYGTSK